MRLSPKVFTFILSIILSSALSIMAAMFAAAQVIIIPRDAPVLGEEPLPAPPASVPSGKGLLDYRCVNELSSSSLTLLMDGTLIYRVTGGANEDKELHSRLSAEEIEFYRRLVAHSDFQVIEKRDLSGQAGGRWSMQCQMWVRKAEGDELSHFAWNNFTVLPLALTRLRDAADDLARAAEFDKPHQDPFLEYVPRRHDILVDWAGRNYRVVAYNKLLEVVEVESTDRVVRIILERRHLVDRFKEFVRPEKEE